MKDLTSKENAKKLVDRFYHEMNPYAPDSNISFRQAKQFALIAVNEIIDCTKNGLGLTKFSKEYWQEVKQEIEKL